MPICRAASSTSTSQNPALSQLSISHRKSNFSSTESFRNHLSVHFVVSVNLLLIGLSIKKPPRTLLNMKHRETCTVRAAKIKIKLTVFRAEHHSIVRSPPVGARVFLELFWSHNDHWAAIASAMPWQVMLLSFHLSSDGPSLFCPDGV